jgi:hypothetical protein
MTSNNTALETWSHLLHCQEFQLTNYVLHRIKKAQILAAAANGKTFILIKLIDEVAEKSPQQQLKVTRQ